jgi:hypothetical protein
MLMLTDGGDYARYFMAAQAISVYFFCLRAGAF